MDFLIQVLIQISNCHRGTLIGPKHKRSIAIRRRYSRKSSFLSLDLIVSPAQSGNKRGGGREFCVTVHPPTSFSRYLNNKPIPLHKGKRQWERLGWSKITFQITLPYFPMAVLNPAGKCVYIIRIEKRGVGVEEEYHPLHLHCRTTPLP